jgi:hypothetical protein
VTRAGNGDVLMDEPVLFIFTFVMRPDAVEFARESASLVK